ncbi:DinB family protein [Paenibacillus sp. P96]|uniref:DinB family protein n=1 Tax=Paenibacillus zeirhizosphaerae TaxID=2987519 RepID=A0ABT9FNR1_9BACL|nr:DinB family protein [Paenibacillus sp. P96]MDP4096367.1 DinB family protein [Paenibacillus sp. P96]
MSTNQHRPTIAAEIGKDLKMIMEGLLEDVFKIIRNLPPEALNWRPEQMNNSPYVLAYHLLGSAGYWIGDVVGGIPTDRIRANEFGVSGDHEQLEKLLADTKERLVKTFDNLQDSQLQPAPIDLSRGVLCWGEVPPEGRTAMWVLVHDLCHIAFTLGQLDRIHRLWEIQSKS